MQEPERGVPGAAPGQSGVPAASARPDLDSRQGAEGDTAGCQLSPGSEQDGAPQTQEESSGTPRVPPPDAQRVHSAPELVRPLRAMDWTDRPPKSGADYSFLVSQNTKLLSALEDLRHRCSSLAEENSLLRRSCFPQTEEKVKHLKRKNAELAVIAKRLEERARKLQEANLKVVTAPMPLKGSSLELCKKAFARQRAKDLTEQASALLAKDKQIEALQQECRELQAKLLAGKDDPSCLKVIEFDHLLRESQREVLRLQRQIALKNFKECLRSSKMSAGSAMPSAAARPGPINSCLKGAPQPKEEALGDPSLGGRAHREVEPGVQALGPASEGHENFPPKNAVTNQESSKQIQQLEVELKKKRKKCENLEHEVRKKHKRCKELEIQLQEVQSENARLAEENLQLNQKAGWAGQVESENADLKLQVVLVTKERDSVIQTNQGLQTKLENLEQVLKHMRNVAERRQQLEVEHKEALLVLQEKQEEVRRLQQAQAEARREHEGAVQLLESTLDCMQARVKDLEDQCRSQTEQFSLLSQELQQFRLQTGKIDLLTSTLVTSELPLALCSSASQPRWENESAVPGLLPDQSTKKVHNEGSDELELSQRGPNTTVGSPAAPTSAQKHPKKGESQSSSSKSESMQNSPKSCPTPEVDTASEVEELDVDSISLMPEPGSQGPAKLQVFLARYSYNPFDGPNENPEAELPLTAGEYIYIYGDMDEDGFFEGTPDAPLDVQVEAGPSPGILVISWLPVTIDAEGSSNGVRVTGYAVYADGQKVIEVTSPTAGSVLVDLSQLQMFQVCREVSVRTMSQYGESVDSVPAQISSVLLQSSHCTSPVCTTVSSRLPRWAPRALLPTRSPQHTLQLRQITPAESSDAKLTDPSSSPVGSVQPLTEKASSPPHLPSPSASLMQAPGTSPQGSDTEGDKKCLSVPPQQAGTVLPEQDTEPGPSQKQGMQQPGEGTEVQCWFVSQMEQPRTKAPELGSPTDSGVKLQTETCHVCSVQEAPKGRSADMEREAEKHLSPEPPSSPSHAGGMEDTFQDGNTSGSGCQAFLRLSPGKEVMKEMSRVKREQQEEKLSEMGRRQLALFTEHNRSSDLSDILEEEEEDELSSEALEEKKWGQREPCSQENGEKMDLCDTDSDEEILERILELPLQKNHSKKLFSIPEVTEDEDEDEDEKAVTEEKTDPQDSLETQTYHSGRTEKPPNSKELFLKEDGSNTSMDVSAQTPQGEHGAKESRAEADRANPAFGQLSCSQKKSHWNWGYQENDPKSGSGTSPSWNKKKGNNYREKIRSRPEISRKRQSDLTEHCSRLLGNCSQMGSGLYRAPSLREELNVVSSAGGKEGLDLYSRAREGTLRKKAPRAVGSGGAEPAMIATHCPSPRSLEIDIEYDSEDDQDSTCASSLESRLWPERSQSCQGDWSDYSSQSEVAHVGGRRDLTRLEMMEEQGMEWAGSPSQHLRFFCREKEALRCESSSEEQGWELDCKSPGWRRRLEHSSKGKRSTSLHKRASSHKDSRGLESPGTAAWQAPSRRRSRSERRSQMQKPLLSSPGLPRSTAPESSGKDDGIRVFVALFDYDPVSMSPNPDAAEEELPFKEGQILKVWGDKDADGFYRGECAGREGYIPCNMVSEVPVESSELKQQLLKQGFLPADTESPGNGTFSPPPRRQTVPPPKPRRSKKGLDKQECKSQPGQKHKDIEAELLTPRRMVAAFDYNPKESSPNTDVEAELTFSAGDVITVFGSMDDDGFYYGELNQRRGLVPSNFLEAVPLDGNTAKEFHSKDKEASLLSAESQLNPDGSVDQSDSSPSPPLPAPSCLVPGEQSPEQASLALLTCSDVPGQSKKKRGFFFKGKNLFKRLGSNKKN
ncbi:peripheral-type benzodiazepine receptor-associated protein 1 isoform X9 [Motacilla alba alba]|uniref:peripheral-type benzodiazepine receptor-associated protein 1 isoform X9 n=1 Tax=Motacilla alba alba TaxID=1094192 RepID=UPI0018D4E4B6|nr:peripheral-type benzodiazepine receptor-associated protein 1 isoform X9 [Motacilla alba alba]